MAGPPIIRWPEWQFSVELFPKVWAFSRISWSRVQLSNQNLAADAVLLFAARPIDRERVVCHVVKEYAKEMGVTQPAPHDLRHVPNSAKLQVESWNKSNSFLDTCRCRRPNATSDANSGFAEL